MFWNRPKVSLYDRHLGRFSPEANAFGKEIESRLLSCFYDLRQEGFNGRELVGEAIIRVGLAQCVCLGTMKDYDPMASPDEKGRMFGQTAYPVLKSLVGEALAKGWTRDEVTVLFVAFLPLPAGRSMNMEHPTTV
jgi:hypothetical protein